MSHCSEFYLEQSICQYAGWISQQREEDSEEWLWVSSLIRYPILERTTLYERVHEQTSSILHPRSPTSISKLLHTYTESSFMRCNGCRYYSPPSPIRVKGRTYLDATRLDVQIVQAKWGMRKTMTAIISQRPQPIRYKNSKTNGELPI